MKKSNPTTLTHGGPRKGAGRPPLPETIRRFNVTVKLAPGTVKSLGKLSKETKFPKGRVIEFFIDSPESKHCREIFRKKYSKKK